MSEISSRPSWLRNYVPELDGLRGIAILTVVFYHCENRLTLPWIHAIVQWGWAGVNLFFVLSGFLITGIILDTRDDPHFFRNFYARRSLRIWPVYALLLLLNFVIVPLIFYGPWATIGDMKRAPWPYLVLFVQNLFFITLPGTIGPTWSLAIEEQFYVVWAPLARLAKNTHLVAALLLVIIGSPFLRAANHGALTPTHTLIHLDGLAFGSLVAITLRTWRPAADVCRKVAYAAFAIAVPVLVYLLYGGSAFSDSFLAMTFAAMLLLALAGSGTGSMYSKFLVWRPLKFYGKISYGLYMMHILTFVLIGALDKKLERYGVSGDLAIVAIRFALATTLSWAMFEYFERPILRLKKYFHAKAEPREVGVTVAAAERPTSS